MSEKIINKESLEMYENDQAKYSIIVNRRRAFPEVRDGLKPVQRRVIYAAYKDGLNSPRLRDKSASLVGETMKRYHPHGDCLDGDTVIYGLDNSFRTIKEIYESGIKYLDILAVDPNTGKLIPAKATHFRIGKIDNKEYHIILSNGADIKCTGNHPFMLANGIWVKAENLQPFTRLFQRTMLKSNGRLIINDVPVHFIVHDYYYGNPGSGYDRHHKDYNTLNNIPENIIALTKQEHTRLHGKDESSLYGLEQGRISMFSEDGKYREKIRNKNSILAQEFNKDAAIRKFKYVIKLMEANNQPITEEVYESYRGTVYNMPIISRLIKKHPEYGCNSFEDLVNYKIKSVGELYNERVQSEVILENESIIKPIDFYYNYRAPIYKAFDAMIDLGLTLSLENFYIYNQKRQHTVLEEDINDQQILFLMNMYCIERPFISEIKIVETEPKEYYDFTVDGVENMMIPVVTDMNQNISSMIGYNCPMICVHNSSIYEAIVTLTSWFKTKYPIFYGQGSWGNVSGAGAAASRYTECALSNFGYDVLIDELAQSNNIVDWLQTYKRNNDREPEFLPSKLPLVLINGTFGIGVGMAVNVPSHNIKEVIAETQKLIKNPKADVFLIPDLPQDCILIDTDWKSICDSGYGSFKVRGKIITEQDKNGNYILRIVSLPDMTNTGDIVDKILKMVEEKQLPMIKDVIDDLKDSKPNIIIQLRPGTDPSYVKQVLYAKTQVQKTMSVNFEAVDIDGINTRRFSYKDYLLTFIAQRENIKFRLYCNRLQQVLTRHHHIDAFVKVLESGEIDNIISMIKKSKGSDDEIVEYIIKKCKVTDLQAKFIINANIARLSMRHLLEYKAERTELEKKIRLYEPYVTDDGTLIKKEIYDELTELSKKYGDERKCIVKSIDEENQIPKGTFKVVITDKNYIRKIPDTDKVNIVRKDNPKFIIRIDNSENLLIFDNKGKVFNLPVHKIPISDRTSPGTDVRILIKNLTSNIISIFSEPIFKRISELGKKHYLVVATKSNTIKKLDIEDFLNVGPSGLIYSKVRDDDEVTGLALAAHDLDVVVNSNHKALRMRMKDISLLKRNAYGPKAMNTDESINGLSVIYPDSSDIIVLTKNGKFNRFGSPLMSTHARASKGSSCIKLDPSDEIFGIYGASESDSIRVVTSEAVEEVPVINIKSKSSIAAGQKMLTSKGVILKADIIR